MSSPVCGNYFWPYDNTQHQDAPKERCNSDLSGEMGLTYLASTDDGWESLIFLGPLLHSRWQKVSWCCKLGTP